MVDACSSIERVGSDTAVECVVTDPARQKIVPAQARKRIVAAETSDGIAAARSEENIVARGAVDDGHDGTSSVGIGLSPARIGGRLASIDWLKIPAGDGSI
jgi:hypothetical protein